jgi:CAAX prenyl protease-like protein
MLNGSGVVQYDAVHLRSLYPMRALLAGVVLLRFKSRYDELRLSDLAALRRTAVSIITGVVVFLLWITMDWPFATFGTPRGFNPTLSDNRLVTALLIVSRLAGTAIIVPVMEELFWRSFLLRYIIHHDFKRIPIGRFSWHSFVIATILFGLEHNLYLAGMMAGAAYTLLLYRTRSIVHCVLAHAVTNGALGIYVLSTGQWHFW